MGALLRNALFRSEAHLTCIHSGIKHQRISIVFQPGVATRIDELLLCEYVSMTVCALGSSSLVRGLSSGDSILLPLAVSKLASLIFASRSLSLSHHLEPGPRHLRTEHARMEWKRAKVLDLEARPVHRDKGHVAAVEVGIGICQVRPRQRFKHDALRCSLPVQSSTVVTNRFF